MLHPGHTSLGAAYQIQNNSALAVLVAGQALGVVGTVDVRTAIWLQRVTAAGTPGFLSLANIIAGAFDILSSSNLDTSSVRGTLHQGGAVSTNEKLAPSCDGLSLSSIGTSSDGYQIDTVALVAGGKTVNTHYVPSGARFMLQALTAGGVMGHLSYTNVVPGNPGSFDIVSSDAGDISVIQYAIIDPATMGLSPIGANRLGNNGRALQVLRGVMAAGTVTIPGVFPTASKTGIILQRVTPGGALGHLTVGTVTAGDLGSVVCGSNNAGDTSTVDAFVWNIDQFGNSL